MRQNDVATRGEQDTRRPRHPRNPRILYVLVNLNILNRRGELEGFAFLGMDVDTVEKAFQDYNADISIVETTTKENFD